MTWPLAVLLLGVLAAALVWRWLELLRPTGKHAGELAQLRQRVDVHEDKLRDLHNRVTR